MGVGSLLVTTCVGQEMVPFPFNIDTFLPCQLSRHVEQMPPQLSILRRHAVDRGYVLSRHDEDMHASHSLRREQRDGIVIRIQDYWRSVTRDDLAEQAMGILSAADVRPGDFNLAVMRELILIHSDSGN